MAGHISKNLMATSNQIWPHLPYMATVGNTGYCLVNAMFSLRSSAHEIAFSSALSSSLILEALDC